ncbi:transcriptional regulator GcvA [Pseudomonas aeruginosa]|uniref:transcriptional regulator GcvA n=1 Tax=Pseudomonas aeruginosa TaxID=287 RepID=UPI000F51D085|nr:transcriptional regulator GcvA [Pseudomonas aeruginosa]RQG67479.1 LysR family transcriptional regulator [Pseudomonas aeruginosa]
MTTRRRLPNLNALRAFEAAARRLSITLAAEELCVTQSAVSRQIKALEDDLGTPLFIRLTRSIERTEQGKEYLPVVRDAFDRLEQATLRLRSRRERAVLTVNVLPTFAMEYLIPRLIRFNTARPDIEVRIVASIEPINFERDDIDIAIRVGLTPDAEERRNALRIDLQMVSMWTNVRADPLMPDVMICVCSPAFLRAHGPIDNPRDMLGKPLLHNATRAHAWPDWFRAVDLPAAKAQRGTSYGHFFMSMQAAMLDRGVAIVPEILARSAIRSGRLTRVGPEVPSAGAYYLLCRAYQWDTEKVRAFREWMMQERDDFEGPLAGAPVPSS